MPVFENTIEKLGGDITPKHVRFLKYSYESKFSDRGIDTFMVIGPGESLQEALDSRHADDGLTEEMISGTASVECPKTFLDLWLFSILYGVDEAYLVLEMPLRVDILDIDLMVIASMMRGERAAVTYVREMLLQDSDSHMRDFFERVGRLRTTDW